MTNTPVRIASDQLAAEIAPLGAELRRLAAGDGAELLWSGDPAWWSFTAPLLFPIVGGLAGDGYRLGDRRFELPKHGFARRRRFETVHAAPAEALFRLAADDGTRAHYPFDFVLDMGFRIDGAALTMTATLVNDGPEPMPACFGFHPAFRWPLPGGAARADHAIVFDSDEPAPIRRIDATGLVTSVEHPTPIEGRTLPLRDALFEDDALILPAPASRGCTYGAPGGRQLRLDWPDMPSLGIWTKPGAPFLCIEPWQGHADAAGFDGDFRDKPGVVILAAGESRAFTMRVAA